MRGTYGVLVGKPKGKRSPWKHRCTWEDNVKMDLVDVGWETLLKMPESGRWDLTWCLKG
jgi:hypothetical protein